VTIRVLLVDDEAMIRTGLRMVLEAESDIEVVGEAGDGAQAVTAAATLRPDVVLMDVPDASPGWTGRDTTDPRRKPSSESRCSDNIQ
jgi:YesN/AraC family two-component response regulator